jgi:hypothetical protein
VLVYWARVGEGPADEGPANEGIADEGIAGVIGTRFADLRSNTVSGNRLAYTKKFKEAEEARKAAKEASNIYYPELDLSLLVSPGDRKSLS